MTSLNYTLPRSTPEAQGVASAAVLSFLDAVERDGFELHSLMILRHGHVLVEGWWAPYGPQYPHMLFSLSKSFTATAAGFAVAEGKLSLDDAVTSFFPEDTPAEVSPNLAAMKVRHLLSMSTGHDQDSTGRLRAGGDENWVRGFLSLPVEHEPGTHFVYNSGASYMVSAIVQKVTGQTVLDYLRPRLFEPLGIQNPTWESSPQGINVGGWGLNITTEDIARFGLLYLRKGIWQGERLLPESWVDEATSKQVSNGTDPDSDWAQGYGYQFWRCRHEAYRGDGAFGQFCVVLPAQDTVIAMTGGTNNLQGVLNTVWEHLLPALGAETLAEDTQAYGLLRLRLASLELRAPKGDHTSPMAAQVSGRTYNFTRTEADDEQDMEAATWSFDAEGSCVLTMHDSRGEHRLQTVPSPWPWWRGTTTLSNGTALQVAVRGAWTAPDTYTIKAFFFETPFSATIIARFTGDTVQLERRQNVGFGQTERPAREGRAG